MHHPVEGEGGFPLATAGRALTVAGAFAFVPLTLWVGRHGSSLILLVRFVGWVRLPFVGLLLAEMMAVRWSPVTRKTLSPSCWSSPSRRWRHMLMLRCGRARNQRSCSSWFRYARGC
jgi:hypothetical protein